MDVNPSVSQIAATTAEGASSSSSSSSSSLTGSINMNKDDFLKLLVTQLQN